MAATVAIQVATGAGPSYADTSSIRWKTADDNTADTNNPITKPVAGYARSWPKWLRLNCTVAPSVSITNGKFYTDGTPWSGTAIYADDEVTYVQATGAPADDTGYTANPAVGSPITFLDSTFTGTGQIGRYVRSYLRIDNTVSPGLLTPAETLTFSYDEI